MQYRGISGRNLSMVGFKKMGSSSDLSISQHNNNTEKENMNDETPYFGRPQQRLTSSQIAPQSNNDVVQQSDHIPTFGTGGIANQNDAPSLQIDGQQ